jgi:hypothetical protein
MPAKNYTARVPAVGTAGNDATSEAVVCEYNGTVTAVTYSPDATITGANTNTRSVTLANKGQDGSGNTTVATLQFNSGVNATRGDEKAITLSGTAANLVVAAGDVLEVDSTHVGTGITDPGGLVRVTIDRTYS